MQQERSVGGISPLNSFQSSWSRRDGEKRIKVVFIMMLVLIETICKCVMMNKGHKMMPYFRIKKNIFILFFPVLRTSNSKF